MAVGQGHIVLKNMREPLDGTCDLTLRAPRRLQAVTHILEELFAYGGFLEPVFEWCEVGGESSTRIPKCL